MDMTSSSRKEAISKHMCREVWARVRDLYNAEHIVSERGLQAAIYAELREKLSERMYIVVEPKWSEARVTPDLVICTQDEITDVFELKFVPHRYAEWKDDTEKLLSYVKKPTCRFPVRLKKETGRWKACLPIGPDCRLHFVAVSRHDAEAVWRESLENAMPCLTHHKTFHHWYGRVGCGEDRDKWCIQFPRS